MKLRYASRPSASLILVLFFSLCVCAQESPNGNAPHKDYRPRRLLPTQPPNTHFQLKPADEIGGTLNPSELVIGVTIGDEARAYPLNMLSGPLRGIVNDTLGERPIAATW